MGICDKYVYQTGAGQSGKHFLHPLNSILFRMTCNNVHFMQRCFDISLESVLNKSSYVVGHVMALYLPDWTNIGFSFMLLTVNLFRHPTHIEHGIYCQ